VLAGSAATVVDVVDDVLVLVLVLDVDDEVVVAGAPTSTTVGPLSWAKVILMPPTATTRPATTMQRLRRTDVRLMLSWTLQGPGTLRERRHSSVTVWEGFGSWLRPTSGVGAAPQLRLPRWFAASAPPGAGAVDELVVARARRGDQDAFALIVGHYDRRLRALAFRLLGDRDRMDDVLQEVYVKAFRSLPRFKGTAALGTWLYRITYNACLDDLRRRPAPAATAEYDETYPDPAPGPADIAVRRQDLAAALDRLPPDQRTAVLLVDAYGLDYDAAAEVLGVRAGTVGSRLSRARTVLRTALGEGGDQ
jgi:RNA polymerase sigma-70 factor (ECF subfamily)